MPKRRHGIKKENISSSKHHKSSGLYHYWRPAVLKKEVQSVSTPFSFPFQPFEVPKFKTSSSTLSLLPPFPTQRLLQTHYEETSFLNYDGASSTTSPSLPLLRPTSFSSTVHLVDPPLPSPFSFSFSSSTDLSSATGHPNLTFSNEIMPPPPWEYCTSEEVHAELQTLLPLHRDAIHYWLSKLPGPTHFQPYYHHDWCMTFQPSCLQEVLVQPATLLLDMRSWLKAWYRKLSALHLPYKKSLPSSTTAAVHEKGMPCDTHFSNKKKRRQDLLGDPSFPSSWPLNHVAVKPADKRKEMEEDEEVEDGFFIFDPAFELPVSPCFLLEGPPSTGKTSLVYASAQQYGWEVFEINASTKRSGKELETMLGPLIHTYAVDTRKPWLVYIAQIDVLFEEDRGCYASLEQLVLQSKCPIMLSCESSCMLPSSLLHQCVRVRTQTLPADLVMWYVQYRMYLQGIFLHRAQLMKWSESWKQINLKFALRQFEFWTSPISSSSLSSFTSTSTSTLKVTPLRSSSTYDEGSPTSSPIDVVASSLSLLPSQVSSAFISLSSPHSSSFHPSSSVPHVIASPQKMNCILPTLSSSLQLDLNTFTHHFMRLSQLDQLLHFPLSMVFELTEPDLLFSTLPPCPTSTLSLATLASTTTPFTSLSSLVLPSNQSMFLISERDHCLVNQCNPMTLHLLSLVSMYQHCLSFLTDHHGMEGACSLFLNRNVSSLSTSASSSSSFPSTPTMESNVFQVYEPFLTTYTSRHLSKEETYTTWIPFARTLIQWNLQRFRQFPMSRRKTKRSQIAPYFQFLTRSCIEQMGQVKGFGFKSS
ncbi:hypothetical protein HMI54_013259 [Coelomomyces lativittatus]|nr:hypothetical protein HMI56_002328 [Coelomomyces lativittatus]KAJ1505770.1 hypothetical protein HMI55_001455 [Coelomomyces lativittatus]KAJ1514902.1 hypothetical protein HMI54_013259 [Coelomomyces lativittatus]